MVGVSDGPRSVRDRWSVRSRFACRCSLVVSEENGEKERGRAHCSILVHAFVIPFTSDFDWESGGVLHDDPLKGGHTVLGLITSRIATTPCTLVQPFAHSIALLLFYFSTQTEHSTELEYQKRME